MPTGYETKCPLCGTPRAKGQKRCICNYTFEYERESRPFRKVSGSDVRGSARAVILAIVLALTAAGAGTYFYLR